MAILLGAFGAALLITLVLAAVLTPARWWRRPNLKALAVVAAGTWGIGSVLLAFAPERAEAHGAKLPMQNEMVSAAAPSPSSYADLAAGTRLVVFEDLNLRAAAGTGAVRIAVVPAGAVVVTTGARYGDWYEVRVDDHRGVKKRPGQSGWVSSLWLRRADEAHRHRAASAPAARQPAG